MKLPGFLSKPRWLSKDAATRRKAVVHDTDAELVANLGRLAREDADADVRIAAMKRLADPGIAQGLAHDDSEANVRAQARALWLDLLTGTHASAPSLVERVRLLKAQDDNELIERIARHAREPELRQAALDRVTRPALLLERAIEDADAGIRLALVERIDDEAQLARLAERARKSDKQVNRRARERIDALRIARGDDATLEQRARLLCEQLEQLVREPAHADAEAAVTARWQEIEAAVAPPLRARYEAARALLVVSRTGPAPRPAPAVESPPIDPAGEEPAATTPAADETDHAAEPVAAHAAATADAVVAPLLAQARFAASLDEVNAEQRKKREQQRSLLAELEEALHALDAAIDSGTSVAAHAAKSRADDLRRRIEAPLPRSLAQHLAASEHRHAELSQWQHWADDQRRRQLCDEIEALVTSGLHPDAVASRVRDAQAEWTRLDTVEGRNAARPSPLARRFHAACRAAFAPTQEYFKKRQELRQSHAQQVNALLERAGALADDSTDWPAIAALRRDTADALRGLDRVEPRERKALAQRLKTSLAALDARVARRDEDVERAKAALIAEAEALGQGTPQRGAVAAARELQQRWQQAGNGRRARDQAQWKAFRAAIDAVFGRLDAERAERSARDADARAQAEALCAELEALAVTETPDRSAAARLQAAWDALRVRDEHLARRFDAAQASLRDAAQRRERSLRHARFDAWQARYRLCRAAEMSTTPVDALLEQWQHAPAGEIAVDVLAARFAAATAGSAQADTEPHDDEAFRDVLVELELLAGIESPDEDRERRRTRQIGRLSARMSGTTMPNPAQEVATLLTRWSELGPTTDAALDGRVERALAAVLETLP
ncbi:DUF349 domain-containing protein [Dokdonella soli]|uniref:DUF349 domain-containing protein n=1 Tax=Dokdonella soli TaxID=529810 RepID=A0ABN1IDS0_9GAMM